MYSFVKRLFDISVSFVMILVLSPLLLLLYVLGAIFNGFPVIFKQPRPGKNGKIFYLYKFRSMNNKKDKDGNLLPDSKRITRFGKFIRATSLDELPQLFNVLKGDMSIVGPRPKLIKDVIFYSKDVKSLAVRPGITGLAVVNGRNENTWESNFIYDKIYTEKISPMLDIKIMFKTVGVVLSRRGNNDGTQDIVDYYYPNYLLRMGRITREQYDMGLAKAKFIEEEFRKSKSFRKKFVFSESFEEDYDLQERISN